MSFKVKCHEANHICDKNQYREASLWEKIKLTIHLVYCRACRKYTSRNNKLSKAVKSPKVHMINATEKNRIKERLHQEVPK